MAKPSDERLQEFVRQFEQMEPRSLTKGLGFKVSQDSAILGALRVYGKYERITGVPVRCYIGPSSQTVQGTYVVPSMVSVVEVSFIV